MDLEDPARTLAPAPHLDVLAVLAGSGLAMTGRQVHRQMQQLAGQSTVAKALNYLVDTGLVHVARAGSSNLYELNHEHVAADAARALLGLRNRLFERIREALEIWPQPPVAACVFGSAARGDGHLHSDIDLLLVRGDDVDEPQWDAAVAALNTEIFVWSGNRGATLTVTVEQIRLMRRRSEPIIAEIDRDGVALLGHELLRRRK